MFGHLLERAELRERDDPAGIQALGKAWEVIAFAHRLQEQRLLHLGRLADRGPVRLDTTRRALELESRAFEQLLDIGAPENDMQVR